MAFEINGVDWVPMMFKSQALSEIIEATTSSDAGLHVVGVRFLNDYYCTKNVDAGQCNDQGDRNLLVDWLKSMDLTQAQRGHRVLSEWFADCDPQPLKISAREQLERFARLVYGTLDAEEGSPLGSSPWNSMNLADFEPGFDRRSTHFYCRRSFSFD